MLAMPNLPPKGRSWSAEQARMVLAEQERSGLSVGDFAKEHGFNPERLCRWRRKLGASAPTGFVEVRAEANVAPLEIVLRGGHRVMVRGPVDAVALQAIVWALESTC